MNIDINNYYTSKEASNILGSKLKKLRDENKLSYMHQGKQKILYLKSDVDKMYSILENKKKLNEERIKKLKEPRLCLNCNKIIEKPKITQKFCCRSCNAIYTAKKNKPNGIIKCKKCNYKGYILSGTFELRAAYILDKMLENKEILNWEYTSDTIKYKSYDNKEHQYLLDFKYTKLNKEIVYVEVKGIQTNIDEYKWKTACENNINLEIWFNKELKEKEKEYNITNDEMEKLFDECVENHKNNKIIKKCKYCNEDFETTKTKNKKFCSQKCSILYINSKKGIINNCICKNCKKEYIATSNRNIKFCSDNCFNEFYKIGKTSICKKCNTEFIIEKARQINCNKCNKDKFNIITKCKYCNKEFKSDNRSKKYCSNKCLELSKRKILICKECGNEFYGKGNTQFCSNECKNNNKVKTHKVVLTLKR